MNFVIPWSHITSKACFSPPGTQYNLNVGHMCVILPCKLLEESTLKYFVFCIVIVNIHVRMHYYLLTIILNRLPKHSPHTHNDGLSHTHLHANQHLWINAWIISLEWLCHAIHARSGIIDGPRSMGPLMAHIVSGPPHRETTPLKVGSAAPSLYAGPVTLGLLSLRSSHKCSLAQFSCFQECGPPGSPGPVIAWQLNSPLVPFLPLLNLPSWPRSHPEE